MDIEQFYIRYYRMVFFLANKYIKKYPHIDADDLIQEGFVELLQLFKSGKIDWNNPGVTGFIWRRVEGRMKNYIASQFNPVEPFPDDFPEPMEDEDIFLQRELIKDIDDCLKIISDHKDIFIRRVVYEETFDEIAGRIETYRENVRRKFNHIKELLIACLEEKGWEITTILKII